jgi:transcriptional regulator with XRE-family HTH domain
LGLSGLADRAGLSRQGLHRLLRPGHRPLAAGLEAVSAALDVDALGLLYSAGAKESDWENLRPLLEAAEGGNPRAFEELPATLDLPARPAELPAELPPVQHQLLAAAADLAAALWPRPWLPGFVSEQAGRVPAGQAFLFDLKMTGLERLAAATPEPMRRQRVFGVFELSDFARHRKAR